MFSRAKETAAKGDEEGNGLQGLAAQGSYEGERGS